MKHDAHLITAPGRADANVLVGIPSHARGPRMSYRARLEQAADVARKSAEFRAQHGPVKVIVKDGVPCP